MLEESFGWEVHERKKGWLVSWLVELKRWSFEVVWEEGMVEFKMLA